MPPEGEPALLRLPPLPLALVARDNAAELGALDKAGLGFGPRDIPAEVGLRDRPGVGPPKPAPIEGFRATLGGPMVALFCSDAPVE